METILRVLKQIIPSRVFEAAQPTYHWLLATAFARLAGRPARKLVMIGVTGTKGKTTTIELLNAILEEAGKKTAVISTLRFKIGRDSSRNLLKMTMPGRGMVQRYLKKAVEEGATHAIVEVTSQATLQYRHLFLDLDALIVTNLAPEHIESHGSYDNYVEAKVSIARELAASAKPHRYLCVNKTDAETPRFLRVGNTEAITFSLEDARELGIKTPLPGEFNLLNATAAAKLALALGIPLETIKKALASFDLVPGRMESVELPGRTLPFSVIVDYAHTPDSLKAVYSTYPGRNLLCVLGGTGGGRDTWKRKVMGEIADTYCGKIFLTNEDPYDEDPEEIVKEIATGIKHQTYEIIMDRRGAIHKAIKEARIGDVVVITGKGTDPFIMGANGSKIPWSDTRVAEEELGVILREV